MNIRYFTGAAVGLVALFLTEVGVNAQVTSLSTIEQKVGYGFGLEIGQAVKQQSNEVDPEFLGKAVQAELTFGAPWLSSVEYSNVFSEMRYGKPVLPPTGNSKIKSSKEAAGYALGLAFGRRVRSYEPKADVASLVQGVKDILSNGKLLMDTNEMVAIFGQDRTNQMTVLAAQGQKNLTDGPAFLEKNKNVPGVKVLPDGIQYQIITEGKGPKPALRDTVRVTYRGYLIDGQVFDATDEGETATFPLTHVIKGWTHVLQQMPTGSKWKVTVPADLAYGQQERRPNIAANSPLVFEIQLIGIEPGPPQTPAMKAGIEFLTKNAKQPGVVQLDDGLQYQIITNGTGPKPKLSDTVKVNYRGTLVDGTQFDASKPGNPITFGVTQVIPGWTEALQLMPVGSKWKVFIPDYLAYGSQSQASIPADSTLIFDIELLEIQSQSPVISMPGGN